MTDLPTQDQPTRRDSGAEMDQLEHVVLALLIDSEPAGPWSVAEIAQALGSRVAADDAVVSLHTAVLVDRCHDLVFPTRPAIRCSRLEQAA